MAVKQQMSENTENRDADPAESQSAENNAPEFAQHMFNQIVIRAVKTERKHQTDGVVKLAELLLDNGFYQGSVNQDMAEEHAP